MSTSVNFQIHVVLLNYKCTTDFLIRKNYNKVGNIN